MSKTDSHCWVLPESDLQALRERQIDLNPVEDLIRSWVSLVDRTLQESGLTPKDVETRCKELVFEDSWTPDPSTSEPKVLRQVLLDGNPIITLTRTGFLFRMTGDDH